MTTLVVNTQTTKNHNQQTLINNVNISSDIKAEYKETTIEIDKIQQYKYFLLYQFYSQHSQQRDFCKQVRFQNFCPALR